MFRRKITHKTDYKISIMLVFGIFIVTITNTVPATVA